MNESLQEQLDKAFYKCMRAYATAKSTLDEITVLIQKKYPELTATIGGGEIFFTDENGGEYYTLEHIEQVFGKR